MTAQSDAQASSSGSTEGRLLVLAHVAWFVCAALAFLILLASIPFGYLPHLDNAFSVPIDAPDWYVALTSYFTMAVSLLTAFVSIGVAALLFWKRRTDRLALVVSYFLLAYGIVIAGPLELMSAMRVELPLGAWHFRIDISSQFVSVAQTAIFAVMGFLLYVFPNGRFVPGWMRYAALLFLLLTPAYLYVYSFEWPRAVTPLGWFVTVVSTAILSLCVYAQIYRYRRVSTSLERQQIKWVVFGLFLTFAIDMAIQIPYYAELQIPAGGIHPWWEPVSGLVWTVSLAILPLSLAVAVTRYRLWDVDLIINRTLVYGTLSAGIVVIYVLTVGLVGAETRSNANLLAALMTLGLAAFLYTPARARVQRLVDRLFRVSEGRRSIETGTERVPAPPPPRRWLIVAQAAWLICAVVAVLILLAAIPLGYAPYVAKGAAEPYLHLLYLMSASASFLVAAMSVALAALLFWKRRDEPIALYVGLFLMLFGVVLAGPSEMLGNQTALPLDLLDQVESGLLTVPMVTLLYLLPNGRFVPGWTRWAALGAVLLSPGMVVAGQELMRESFTPTTVLVITGFFVLTGIGVYAQVYRYRRAATPIERQQIKWVMFGLLVNIFFQIILGIPYIIIMNSPQSPGPVFAPPLGDMTWWLLMGLPPAGIAIAVLRYRLWDVDILINRTLLYGTLTAGIIALYVLVVGTLSTVSQTTGNLLISLIATGLVALMVQPLRERLQRGVNRLLYGERDEPYAVMARLSRDIETTAAPDAILHSLVRTIAQAMKLPYIAIETTDGEGAATTATFGEPRGDVQIMPLTYQGQPVGRLRVAPRSANEPLSPADLNLLKIIAQQAGMAVHAVQLTEDLQRSRERLVIAREEERRRIRRDLHDGLGPVLASLAMRADEAREWTQRNPERTEATLAEIAQKSQAALQDIRRLVYDLRPPALDELGLVGALKQTAANSSNGLHIEIDTPDALPPLSAAVEAAAYRIAQETLNNVARHARAQNCVVRIRAQDDLQIEIDDDGVGLPPDVQPGVGLMSMRERAAELGGTCVIDARPGGGTRVMARLPLMAG